MPDDFDPTSFEAYAKRLGVPSAMVYDAVKCGRLTHSVIFGARKKPLGIVDLELADKEWEANAELQTSSNNEDDDFEDSKEREQYWKSKHAELKYKEAARELIPASEVESVMKNDYMEVRTKLLALSSRIRQQLPHLTQDDVTKIDDLVREALMALLPTENLDG